MTWKDEPGRHALASKGIITADREHPVYVGGRTSPRMRTFTRGGRTDVSNAFHTTTDPEVAQSFIRDENHKLYKMEIDLSNIPEERILRAEDWTYEMAKDFTWSGLVYFKHLKEIRPDLVSALQDKGYKRYISVEMLSSEKPLDVFVYPHIDDLDYGLQEKEVAIFNRDILLDAWHNKEEVVY